MNHYSFDIFDTLISRRSANDKGVFVTMRETLRRKEECGFPHYFVDEFVNIRVRAQQVAHTLCDYPEITLSDIYAALAVDFPDFTQQQLRELQQLEESVEIEHCYPIPENIEQAMHLAEAGHRVLLISDMYLSKDVINQMLARADGRLCTLPLYLSSELKMRKSDGTLFRHVCSDQGIPPSSLTHVGDNFKSDCVMAKRLGMRYAFYQDSFLSKIEKSYFREEENFFLQLFAGASKQTRLTGYNLKPTYRLGASFTGPMFYGFVHNVLKRAMKEGFTRLYFLARDGYLLKIIAEEIIACYHYDIEIRYLYTSRQATYFASIFHLTPSSFEWIFQRIKNAISFSVVAKRLRLEPEVLLDYLDPKMRQSLQDHGLEKGLTPGLINRLQNELLSNAPLKTAIENKACAYRETVVAYFEQEGLLEEERVGLVDIGWRGTLQDAIFKILKSRKADFKLTSYYFAVTFFSGHTSVDNRKVPTFMFPSQKARKGPVFELLLQCKHGTTLNYRSTENGRFEPVIKETSDQLTEWGLEDYERGIRAFSRTLSQSISAYPNIETTYAAIAPILIELLEDATPEVAATLGDLHYSGNIEETNVRVFAPSFTVPQALTFLVASQRKRNAYTQWFEGSYSRSPLLPRILIRLDPRLQFSNLLRHYISREKLMERKQHAKRFAQLHLGFIRKF